MKPLNVRISTTAGTSRPRGHHPLARALTALSVRRLTSWGRAMISRAPSYRRASSFDSPPELVAQAAAPRERTARVNFFLAALLALAASALTAVGTLAQSALTDDAHTSNAPRSADTNFGTNPGLHVSSTGNAYVKFKLSSTLPADTPGPEVERATLKLYIGNVTTAGRLDVYAVSGAWDEGSVTANNAPPLGGLVATTAQVGTDRRGKFLVIDITPVVRQWLGDDDHGEGGIPNHGLALVARPADATTPEVVSITFDSKENSQTSHEPQLDVQLERAAGGLQKVERDAPLIGDGTIASPLGVAPGGINTSHLANGAVTGQKIADRAVTSSGLADGAVTSAKVAAPLSLTSAGAAATLAVENTGAGAAITAAGAINTTVRYDIDGERVLSTPGGGINTFVGRFAGRANPTGGGNSFFGFAAGRVNTTGISNSFFGSGAGFSNTTGDTNSFFGEASGQFNTTGDGNSFFGFTAGSGNTAGSNNSFFGTAAGHANQTGELNSFFGMGAGRNSLTGMRNSFFGAGAGYFNMSGGHNAFFGHEAGLANATGENNTFIGSNTGSFQTTGSGNTYVGFKAGGANGLTNATALGANAFVTQSNSLVLGGNGVNVGIGTTAPNARLDVAGEIKAAVVTTPILNATTQYNIGGQRVLSVAGQGNTFAGVSAGEANTGFINSFFGNGAGRDNTTGIGNSFFGADAGAANTAGAGNSFFGSRAGFSNTTGGGNSFFGVQSGQFNTTGRLNSFFGQFAGQSNETGESNSFFGYVAGGANTTGRDNSFFGEAAGRFNTTGDSNSFFGRVAGANNQGGGNSFFGRSAGFSNTTGGNNVFLGLDAGRDNTTGSRNTYVGFDANGVGDLTNATALGANASVTRSNSLVLGSFNVNVGIGTTAPRTRLHVTGKIYVEANGQGVVLKSPGGTCFELTVSDAGALVTAAVACP